jgi:hypothetical protein
VLLLAAQLGQRAADQVGLGALGRALVASPRSSAAPSASGYPSLMICDPDFDCNVATPRSGNSGTSLVSTQRMV